MQITLKSMGVFKFSEKISRLRQSWVTKTVILAAFTLTNFALCNNAVAYVNTPSMSKGFTLRLAPISVDPNVFNYLTFTPDVKAIGPLFDDGPLQNYFELIFRHIIRQADAKIHYQPLWGYKAGSNRNYSYYTFLVLALAIVQHESRGIHFRQADGQNCSQISNSLAGFGGRREFGPETRAVLAPIYRNPLRPLIPDCRYVKAAPNVEQMIYAKSGDIGIMQMNARFHPGAMDPTILLNVYRSIDAGIDYIWSGYQELRDKLMSPEFSCIRPTNPFPYRFSEGYSKPAIWASLAVTDWSYTYNGQPLCDVSRPNAQFYDDLMSIVRNDSSIWHKYLPEGSVERDALNEIVANFRAAFSRQMVPERHSALDKILESSSTPYGTWTMPSRTLIVPNHFLRRGRSTIYYGPLAKPKYACGYLTSAGFGRERVRVVSTLPGSDRQGWGVIELPKYVSFAHLGTVAMLKLKKGIWAVRVRNSPRIPRRYGHNNVLYIARRDARRNSPTFALVSTATDKYGRLWYKMIDHTGTVVYAAANFFQPFFKPPALADACKGPYFFVPMADLKRLPPTPKNKKSYLAFVIGKGEVTPKTLPSALATASYVSLSPGQIVTVLKSTVNISTGAKWLKIIVGQSGASTLWAPADRFQPLAGAN